MTDTEKVGPVDHITRAILPWRTTSDLTECGKPTAEFDAARLVTRDEAAARIKRLGQQRAAFTLCMTCASTSDRHQNRNALTEDAVAAVERAVAAVVHASPPWRSDRAPSRRWLERQRLAAEFEAIAALIVAHREEFDSYLAGREQTVSLAERRGQRRAKSRDFMKGRPL